MGISTALLCKVFDIQIKMVLVWENSAPQKTLIGAYGNIYTYGKLMKTLLLHLSRNLGNFTTRTRHSLTSHFYTFKGTMKETEPQADSPLLGPVGSKMPPLGPWLWNSEAEHEDNRGAGGRRLWSRVHTLINSNNGWHPLRPV